MSLRFSLILPYFLLLGGMVGISLYYLEELTIQEKLIQEASEQATIASRHALELTNQRKKIYRLLLFLTFNPTSSQTLVEINDAEARVREIVTTLSVQITSREGQRLVKGFSTGTTDAIKQLNLLIQAIQTNDILLKKRYFAAWDFQTRYSRYLLNDLQVFSSKNLLLVIGKLENLRHNLRYLVIVSLLFFALTIVGSLLHVQYRVVRRLIRLKQNMILIGAGNLDTSIIVDGRDELGDLARTFDQLRKDLRSATQNLSQSKEELEELNVQLEKRVEQRTIQLASANMELEAFCYSVSHDLKAPLRGIDGFSSLLEKNYGERLDTQGLDYLRRVRAATQRMAQLIDDLLHLSRLSRQEKHIETVDLSALVEQIALEFQEHDPNRQIRLTIDDHLIVKGDTVLLRAALENLLGNAFKFTSKKTVTEISFGQTWQNEERVFFLSDNGAGFNQAYVHKLFGAFQRLHQDSEFPGTGVGLATVARIIHLHGGRVWAEGTENQGAVFYFTLPSD